MGNTHFFNLDLLKFFTYCLVIYDHCAEHLFESVYPGDDLYVVGLFHSLDTITVPIFTILTGYFTLPIKASPKYFIYRRVSRVIIPYIMWYFLYAVFCIFFYGDSIKTALISFICCLFRFDMRFGHVWYVFMIAGLYLLAPIISPWLERCTQSDIEAYLCIWFFASLLTFVYPFYPDLFANAFINPTPTFYYFTGLGGFLPLGYYIRHYGPLRIRDSILLLVIAYAVNTLYFFYNLPTTTDFEKLILPWSFGSPTVLIAAYAIVSLFVPLQIQGTSFFVRICSEFVSMGYGIYLLHMIPLHLIRMLLVHYFPTLFAVPAPSSDGYTYNRPYGIPSALISIPIHTLLTVVVVYITAKLIRKLPYGTKLFGC